MSIQEKLERGLIPLAEIGTRLVAFSTNILLVRILPPDEYGTYAFALNFALWASVIMDGGINNLAFDRSLKHEFEELNDLFNVRLYLSIATILVIFSSTLLMLESNQLAILIVLFGLLFTSTVSFFKLILRAQQILRSDLKAVATESMFRFFFLLTVFLIGVPIGLYGLVLGYLSIGAISLSIIWRDTRFLKFTLKSVRDLDLIALISKSKHFLVYYFFWVGLTRVDSFFVESNIGMNQLAFYYTAYTIYSSIQLFFSSSITSYLKQVIDKENIILELLKWFLLSFLFACLAFLLIKPFFFLLYPGSYQVSARFAGILIWGLPFFTVSYLVVYLLNYYGLTKVNSLILCIVFAAKVVVLFFQHPSTVERFCYLFLTFEILTFLAILGYFLLVGQKIRRS